MLKEQHHNVNFLRFIFAMIIVYYHILHSNIMKYIGENEIYYTLQSYCNHAGTIVECFFIISGYFLFESIQNKSDVSFTMFTIKKIFRLAPVLIFSIVIGCLFFSQSILTGIVNGLFLQCIGLSIEYKGINWYISALFWATLFYYAILKNFDRKKVNVVIAIIVYFAYLVNINSCNGGFGRETVYGFVNLALARALAGIGLGYLIGLGRASFKDIKYVPQILNNLKHIKFIFFTIFEMLILIFLMKYFLLGSEYQNGIVVIVMFSVLFISFVCKSGGISQLLNQKIFTKLGGYAYSIYVMQQSCFYVLQRTLWQTTIVNHVEICITLSLLFCFLVGVITYYFVERPCFRMYTNIRLRDEG